MQVATATRVPLEVYLRSSDYEPDADYVDGEIEERPMGENDHSAWQGALIDWFRGHRTEWNILVGPELRLQTGPTRIRIPDVAILDRNLPQQPIAIHPPLAIFEILSPEDRVQRMLRKLGDYAGMGVAEIWVIDPATGIFSRFEDGQLLRRDRFHLSSGDREINFLLTEVARLVE